MPESSTPSVYPLTLDSRPDNEAHASGPILISYRTVDTPIGVLHLAGTDAGLARVCFANTTKEEVEADLVRDFPDARFVEDDRLDSAAAQIESFLLGKRRGFDLTLDLQHTRGFRREVLDQLLEIPYGETRSYGAVATAASNPGAARAVGTACATNPLVLVVPCHRVVRSDGSIGDYGGGRVTKQLLLSLEAS